MFSTKFYEVLMNFSKNEGKNGSVQSSYILT